MNITQTKQAPELSSRVKAGLVIGFYLLNLLTGGFFLLSSGRLGLMVDLTATVCYIALTILFYSAVKERRNRQ